MVWFLWVLLPMYAGVVTGFSIAPITLPVITPNHPITVTWFRSGQETEGFVLVKSIVNEGHPGTEAIVTVNPSPGQTSGEVPVPFFQSKTFVLHAVQTDNEGHTVFTLFRDLQTITVPSGTTSHTLTTGGASSAVSSKTSDSTTQTAQPGRESNQSLAAVGLSVTTSSASTVISSSITMYSTSKHSLSDILGSTSSMASSPTASVESSSPNRSSTNRKPNNKVVIIASTLSGVAFLILLTLLVLCLRRRKPKRFSTSTFGSGIFFDRDRMVMAPSPPTRKSGAYDPILSPRSSISAVPSFTETVNTHGSERPGARTDRQMEIEERIQSLQARLISSPRSSTEQMLIGERIDKLHTLKDGKWALEKSDVRPLEMW
ncbi:hypothetical protein WG66_002507 [Moniliophthora roreri]|uniref:Uncharacterized protein n=1 Tax=Moniliophthora roreri TaxID=221103 RepID=A0A0W0G6I3_MONRR|nr:hypothetical protein WG66_002507 [Moniliophthora roreri]